LPKDTLPKDISPKDISPNGHFADERFAERTFCRTDSLPKGQLAENRDVSYFIKMFGAVTHFSTVQFSTIV
jgi:hypothetical protein